MGENKCLLCGEINAPVWVSRMHLLPGVALMVVARQDIVSLELHKELCRKLHQTGMAVFVGEGFQIQAVEVKEPHLKIVPDERPSDS